uniref:uncharacterized protein LOC120347860 n=1 Tax=Styela clava TaxID=7725 RepID=UPI001939DE3C|nr:uncharacterized protein LOC120347860 [Styela clava]
MERQIMKLQKETILAEVLANESVDIPVKFNLGPYLHKLSPNCHLLFTAFGKIRELEEQYNIATHYVGIKYPEIEIQKVCRTMASVQNREIISVSKTREAYYCCFVHF